MADAHSTEVWKPIKGYALKYDISNHGRVRSRSLTPQNRKSGGARKLQRDGCGYERVRLHADAGGIYTKKVHQLVAQAFIGPRPTPEHEVNHKDGIRHNNRAENLEYVTRTGNMRHALQRRGPWGRMLTIGPFHAAKTHCPKGHSYSLENTRYTHDGRRECRECVRVKSRTRVLTEKDRAYRKAYMKAYIRKSKRKRA